MSFQSSRREQCVTRSSQALLRIKRSAPNLRPEGFLVQIMLTTAFGAENRNRTYDLRVTSALLYRLSYFGLFGGQGGIRTLETLSDLLP